MGWGSGEISSAPYVSVPVPAYLKMIINSSWPSTGSFSLLHQEPPLSSLGFASTPTDCCPSSPSGRRLPYLLQATTSNFIFSDLVFCLNCAFGTGYVGTGSTKKQNKKHAGWLKTLCSTQEAAPLAPKVCELMFCGSAGFHPWSSSKNTVFTRTLFNLTSNINVFSHLFTWFLWVL